MVQGNVLGKQVLFQGTAALQTSHSPLVLGVSSSENIPHYFSWGFPYCFSPGVEYNSIKVSVSKSGTIHVTTKFAE